MFATSFASLLNPEYYLRSPVLLLMLAFQIWMLVDAIRRREWLWVVLIFVFSFLTAVLYFFFVYRTSPAPAMRGFELPGAHDRRQIKELEDKIHHLDKAHHHSQLGDIYFQQGKLDKAEACYRAALERDAEDLDTRSHLGQCLLRQNHPDQARPLLEGVCAQEPRHEYGHSLMALAETYMALDERAAAIRSLEQVLQSNSYARARVQLAELYLAENRVDEARAMLREVVEDDAHAPAFQRQRERVWSRRAKSLLRQLG